MGMGSAECVNLFVDCAAAGAEIRANDNRFEPNQRSFTLVTQIEERDVSRLQDLTTLAQLRGVSVRGLMRDLGL